jgi:hypothetical protein
MLFTHFLAQTSATATSMSTSQWIFIGLIALGGVGFIALLFKMKPQN